MGSQPSFDANDVARPFNEKTWKALTSQATGAPLLNRATDSAYPIGSTFKPITALASLESGLIKSSDTINDDGHYELGPQKYQNAKGASFGTINISDALKVSSDVFFYRLGEQADRKSTPIQHWARRLRLRPHDRASTSPASCPAWCPTATGAHKGFAEYEKCREKAGLGYQTPGGAVRVRRHRPGRGRPATASTSPSARATCRRRRCRSRSPTRRWPTAARSSRRTSARRSRTATASRSRSFRTKPSRKIKINAHDRQVVLDGLRRAASEQGGTSADLFKDFPYKVYGKTGTVERQPNPDQAWYACFVKDGGKPIVVVVTVERGGFGAETAAPAARLILSQWLGVKKDLEFKAGSDQSN